ncbi:MAG: YicC family protein [Burkholderiales bacterium]|nr:YicC family protein [Burkholderiales bacterium]
MIYSMTGYANRSFTIGGKIFQIEIKAVNHRFFDFSFKSSDEIKSIEHEVREKITSKISRGKIDFRITEQTLYDEAHNLEINHALLIQYTNLIEQVRQHIPDSPSATFAEIMNLPGVIVKKSANLNTIYPIMLSQTELAVNDLINSQLIEGEKLKVVLLNKIELIDQILINIKKVLPEVIDNYKNKLKTKITEIIGDCSINDVRFQQEFAYFCQKIDVDEEIARIESHLKMFINLINGDGMVGKKIDFLIQEMHREANTFGSKSISIVTTNYAVELKVLIEQLREQIQNIL